MIDDNDLGLFTSYLGLLIMVLVVVYHFVTADPRLAQQQL
ncbi:hypothetical protein DUNSADRAFT_9563 [Dunaliella salina]|uniref:Dolichyl-diphosphooligosaccharide--protein glycosyltransferase subunit 4 n=1 Tax=Dunaliella salina TaxID=3046 RepID=A0ABQ7GH65_DUNSA|nr:hypothetical protein DUNSADRAFT_9563 [Dunaliella salina]|eukprot:KAF5833951.1 hypothetical protein DUNSADRAFT_9563 [Dunaliella salina]